MRSPGYRGGGRGGGRTDSGSVLVRGLPKSWDHLNTKSSSTVSGASRGTTKSRLLLHASRRSPGPLDVSAIYSTHDIFRILSPPLWGFVVAPPQNVIVFSTPSNLSNEGRLHPCLLLFTISFSRESLSTLQGSDSPRTIRTSDENRLCVEDLNEMLDPNPNPNEMFETTHLLGGVEAWTRVVAYEELHFAPARLDGHLRSSPQGKNEGKNMTSYRGNGRTFTFSQRC